MIGGFLRIGLKINTKIHNVHQNVGLVLVVDG
jgi:hypothetical protein